MNADLIGALKQLNKSWKAFEHNDKPMTKEQVRKALVYGINKGYKHTGELTDEDVDMAIGNFPCLSENKDCEVQCELCKFIQKKIINEKK